MTKYSVKSYEMAVFKVHTNLKDDANRGIITTVMHKNKIELKSIHNLQISFTVSNRFQRGARLFAARQLAALRYSQSPIKIGTNKNIQGNRAILLQCKMYI